MFKNVSYLHFEVDTGFTAVGMGYVEGSEEPKLPQGYGPTWREAAYKISATKGNQGRGLGDVYFQICARVAISGYDSLSPETHTRYRVRTGEFFVSRNELCRLCHKDPKTLKRILNDLVTLGIIEIEDFGEWLCLRLVQFRVEHEGGKEILYSNRGGCRRIPIGGGVGEFPQGVWVDSYTRVGEFPYPCGPIPIPKEKKKKRNEKGEDKRKSPPQKSKILTSVQSGDQDDRNEHISPDVKNTPPAEAIALNERWYVSASRRAPNTPYDHSKNMAAVLKMAEKNSYEELGQVLAYLETSKSKAASEFKMPVHYGNSFYGTGCLLDAVRDEMKNQPATLMTNEDLVGNLMKVWAT